MTLPRLQETIATVVVAASTLWRKLQDTTTNILGLFRLIYVGTVVLFSAGTPRFFPRVMSSLGMASLASAWSKRRAIRSASYVTAKTVRVPC